MDIDIAYFTLIFVLGFVLGGLAERRSRNNLDKFKAKLDKKLYELRPLLESIGELKEIAWEAQNIAISYQSLKMKREILPDLIKKLDKYADKLIKHKKLSGSIRELSQKCTIIMTQDPFKPNQSESRKVYIQQCYKILIEACNKLIEEY